jgi:hypothetical protein
LAALKLNASLSNSFLYFFHINNILSFWAWSQLELIGIIKRTFNWPSRRSSKWILCVFYLLAHLLIDKNEINSFSMCYYEIGTSLSY